MKATLKNYGKGSSVASCFVGAKTIDYDDFIATKFCEIYDRMEFVVFIHKENEYVELTEITIDLEKNQPCIYACMREGLEVEVEFSMGKKNTYKEYFDFSYDQERQRYFAELGLACNTGLKSIKILGLDKMEGVEIK